MNIKMLRPVCEESRRLIQWVGEGRSALQCTDSHCSQMLMMAAPTFLMTGVYDAIKNQYLQTLLFGIATNMDGSSLLEVSKSFAMSDLAR